MYIEAIELKKIKFCCFLWITTRKKAVNQARGLNAINKRRCLKLHPFLYLIFNALNSIFQIILLLNYLFMYLLIMKNLMIQLISIKYFYFFSCFFFFKWRILIQIYLKSILYTLFYNLVLRPSKPFWHTLYNGGRDLYQRVCITLISKSNWTTKK